MVTAVFLLDVNGLCFSGNNLGNSLCAGTHTIVGCLFKQKEFPEKQLQLLII